MLLYAFLIAKLELVEDRIKRLRSLILSEISCNHPRWAILQRLLSSLNHIAAASQKNKMDSSNLAIIFGPSLVSPATNSLKSRFYFLRSAAS